MFLFALAPRHIRITVFTLLALSVVFAFSFIFVAFAYTGNAVCSNATLDGFDIGGMDGDTLSEFVDSHIQKLCESRIIVSVGGSKYSFLPEDIGVKYDKESTISTILGYRGTGVQYYVSAISNFLGKKEFFTHATFDREVAKNTFFEKVTEIHRPINAQIIVENGAWVVKPSKIGYSGDIDVLLDRIEGNLHVLGKREFAFDVHSVVADFTTEHAESLMPRVLKITQNDHNLVVNAGKIRQTFPIDFHDGSSWLVITRSNAKEWDVTLNEVMIVQVIIDRIAPLVERHVQHVEIKGYEKKKGLLYANAEGVAQDGIKIDLSETLKNISEHLEAGIHETNVVVDHLPARIITPEDSPYQFPDRLSAGLSNYATSSDDRIHNVKLGLSKFHNRVVVPGEILSNNAHVMPVTNEAGYKNELAIFGGGGLKKVPGGGLCQVSTTIYRAFFNGGFNIIERYPHSLYVHYYTAYQDGLDATIYPSYGGDFKGKDLRIVNDYSHAILVQTYTNDETLDAVTQIFGTSDGRTVEISGPTYLENTWIGTDYIEDPSLAPGVEYVEVKGSYGKLIHWNRIVTYEDGKVNNEDVYSRYNAKKRVVRVGVGASHASAD